MWLPRRSLFWIGPVGYSAPRVGHRFKDGATIRVGPIALTAHVTGGHSRGCTSWSFQAKDGDRLLNVVSACSLLVMAPIPRASPSTSGRKASRFQQLADSAADHEGHG